MINLKVTYDIKSRFSENSELSCDIKILNNVKRFFKNLKLSHERQKQEKEIANTLPSICLKIDRNVETERSGKENSSDSLPGVSQRDHILPTKNSGNVQAFSSIVTEFVQDLLEELLSSDDPLQTIKFSSPKTIVPGSISIKRLANSFCQANVARNKTILAKRSEITL